ncbi:protein of unknown function (plasmid) [Azospirillum baldaniorum]|uniref:AMP-dependent synthetase/ligase domain-containing protein n=1 Tax=Azospirillum baldaniorum TaxID=1064539 RepID=A0A9P1NQN6_9PROT|nr:AMP-binding protein [Azospirillum baldaniorum]CCD02193.1 protein of unknown function [Azospirillum baldaniorum]
MSRPTPADALHYAARLRYINGYGPTENTAAASIGILRPDSPWMSAGRPLPNTAIHILDEDGEPVPPGAIGHVWLSGLGLAIGYLNRPDLTAAAFVETAKGRRYRTGDLGRWLPNGELLVLGRSDSQVKLRGQRVELGEIEHRLESYPGVQQAVALVDAPPGGTQTLWAFVSLAPDAAEPTQATWAAHAAAALPAYMVPAAVIRVPAIPVTVAGKVDRKALLQAAGRPRALRRHSLRRLHPAAQRGGAAGGGAVGGAASAARSGARGPASSSWAATACGRSPWSTACAANSLAGSTTSTKRRCSLISRCACGPSRTICTASSPPSAPIGGIIRRPCQPSTPPATGRWPSSSKPTRHGTPPTPPSTGRSGATMARRC